MASTITLRISCGLAVILVGACFWIYYLRPAMRLGYIDSAIGTLRAVDSAEKQFMRQGPDRGYACKFSELQLSGLEPIAISGLIKNGKKSGYQFELSCGDEKGGVHKMFRITARPLNTEMPAYCSDQSGIVRYDAGGSATKCLQSGMAQ